MCCTLFLSSTCTVSEFPICKSIHIRIFYIVFYSVTESQSSQRCISQNQLQLQSTKLLTYFAAMVFKNIPRVA